jgi:hypothetical protein
MQHEYIRMAVPANLTIILLAYPPEHPRPQVNPPHPQALDYEVTNRLRVCQNVQWYSAD